MADGVEIDGLTSLLNTLGRLPDRLDESAKAAGESFTRREVPRVRGRAARAGKMQALAARSVRADGSSLVGAAGGGVPAAIFYGAEFGGQRRPTTQQFQPFRGTRGYWFFPQIRDDEDQLISAYDDALSDLENEWRH